MPQFPAAVPKKVESEGPFWATYVKGVVALMNRSGSIPPFDAIIATSVPLGGGLSSSAALEVATCQFVEQLCPGVQLGSLVDKALLCQQAEHRYAGVPCGIMDQFVSFMGKDKHALFIDCRCVNVCGLGDVWSPCEFLAPPRSREVHNVPIVDDDVVVLVTNSNYRHNLVDNEYEKRRQTCEAAARKLGKGQLRDVTLQELEGRHIHTSRPHLYTSLYLFLCG